MLENSMFSCHTFHFSWRTDEFSKGQILQLSNFRSEVGLLVKFIIQAIFYFHKLLKWKSFSQFYLELMMKSCTVLFVSNWILKNFHNYVTHLKKKKSKI